MENNNNKDMRYREAEKRVKKIKGFYIHLMVYILVNLFVLGTQFLENGQNHEIWDWKLLQLPLFWGIGLAAHGLSVFLPIFLFGKEWEEKKIKELMNKNNK